MPELKQRFSDAKTLQIDYLGIAPTLPAGATVTQAEIGRLELTIDPNQLTVPQAITQLSQQVEITDLSVSSITAEEMVAKLYKEYHI